MCTTIKKKLYNTVLTSFKSWRRIPNASSLIMNDEINSSYKTVFFLITRKSNLKKLSTFIRNIFKF